MWIEAKDYNKETWNSPMSLNLLPWKMMELLPIYLSKWTRESLKERKQVDQERVQKNRRK